MRFMRYGLVAVGIFFSVWINNTLANTTSLSFDPMYAEGPFIFWCKPYIHSFEENGHYMPTTGPCVFSIPASIYYSSQAIIGVYRGVPGNAVLVGGDLAFRNPTLVQEDLVGFYEAQEGDRYFAVVYPYDVNFPEQNTKYSEYFQAGGPLPDGAVENSTYYILPWVYGPTPVEELDPVVIIPGILGSWEKDDKWILDPIAHTYDNLVDTLLANGYTKEESLFTFPYDWKKSNVVTAQLLGEKIEEIKESCDCSYVDLVVHSMGGLVASQYVASETYGNDVDQILYLGTPLAGAPKAYKTWEAGEVDFGEGFENTVMQRIFEREAKDTGFNTVLDYIRSGFVSSIQELLPVYDYLSASPPVVYPIGYPQNSFLENLLQNFGKVFNGARLQAIIGNTGEASTTSGYVVQPSTKLPKWEHGEPIVTFFERGDGTVPEYSSIFMFPAIKEFEGVNHTQLVSSGAGYVFELLSNRPAEELVNEPFSYKEVDYGILIKKLLPSSGDVRVILESILKLIPRDETVAFVNKILLIVLLSPIDMEVTAPDGKRIGKNTATGTIVNEVPNALYSGPTAEHEYVLILDPLPGTYQVKTKGTGSGNYIIAAGYADNATSSVSFVSGTTTLNQIKENILTLSPTSTTILIKETQPTSTPPTVITPQTCVQDMQLAYKNKWIIKKDIYNALVSDCNLLGVLIATRDSSKTSLIRKSAVAAINLVLDHMDKLARDKSNKNEAVQLITKNTVWFRARNI